MIRKVLALFVIFPMIALQGLAQDGPIVLDDGTPLRLRTTRSMSSSEAHVDDRVDFEVVDDVKVGDVVVIRHGTPAIGTVTGAQPKGRMGRWEAERQHRLYENRNRREGFITRSERR